MKFGVLGLGSIGSRHARNLRSLGHEVLGYDPDEKKMRENFGKTWTRDEVVAKSDAFVIASPTPKHHDDWAFCGPGRPDGRIFIEKPLANMSEMPWFAAESPATLKKIRVGYMLRFHPCVKAAKAWLEAGHIGEPIWASFTCGQFNDKPDYLRDGVILNWSHEIDLALYLLGPAKVVAASVHCNAGNDDIADFVLQHASGARSTIHLDYVTRNEIRESWIVGTEKNIGMDLLGRRNSMGKIIQEFGGSFDDDYLDEMNAFANYATGQHVIDIRKGPPVQFATGEDGLAVLEICHQVREIAGLSND